MASRAIVAVDPGCLHTGVVYMDEIGIIDSETIAFKTGVRGDNGLLDERCEEIWRRLRAFLEGHPHDLVVVEGYQQQGGRGHMSMSHQTPWLVGSITAHLHQAGEPLAIQLSARVLNPKARGNCAWAADDVSDKYGISAATVRTAYRKGWLRGAPPRGLSRPILFRPEDVERWVSGEPPVERDEDAWRC